MSDQPSSGEVRKYLQQSHDKIFESNRKWAAEQKAKHPDFFTKLSAGQTPDYLWIGEWFCFWWAVASPRSDNLYTHLSRHASSTMRNIFLDAELAE